ncbi:interleukin-1 alpha [Suncus etruscus]|uniref:interleukin-1 alpha n=1 Tax=Suncus etruscus TaxID=109475 RepID=UPI002110BBE8|nr:interleukin-1 alpha [Suncus etruscus]
MAQVPDLFEDLKSCYSENEEYSSEMEHHSLTQKSFYDTNYGPLHESHMNKCVSLSTSNTLKTSTITFKNSMVVMDTHGDVLKKRTLSLNEVLTDADLEVIANTSTITEEEIKPRSISYNFQSNLKYRRVGNNGQFMLQDGLNQNITQQDNHLRATASQREKVIFDMDFYLSEEDDSKAPVTLRISETQLFVSAQNEGEPVLLKEMGKTPEIIEDETNILFMMEPIGSMNYFQSVAYPDLYLATKEENFVYMAKRSPHSITDFRLLESRS